MCIMGMGLRKPSSPPTGDPQGASDFVVSHSLLLLTWTLLSFQSLVLDSDKLVA